jgi:predicted small lipoprotein YifL
MKKIPIMFAASAALSVALLAGCGNKGPLVRPADIPPPAEAMPGTAPATDDATLPDLTPPAQPPVTDTVAPAPASDAADATDATDATDAADATTTPPPVQDDGD